MRASVWLLLAAFLSPVAGASVFPDTGSQVAVYAAETPASALTYSVCGGHWPSHPGASASPWACFVLPGSRSLTVSIQDALPGVHGFWLIAAFENIHNEWIGATYVEACGSVTIPEPEGAHDVSVGVMVRALADCPAPPTTGIVTVAYEPAG